MDDHVCLYKPCVLCLLERGEEIPEQFLVGHKQRWAALTPDERDLLSTLLKRLASKRRVPLKVSPPTRQKGVARSLPPGQLLPRIVINLRTPMTERSFAWRSANPAAALCLPTSALMGNGR
jgi:hypothetical protein